MSVNFFCALYLYAIFLARLLLLLQQALLRSPCNAKGVMLRTCVFLQLKIAAQGHFGRELHPVETSMIGAIAGGFTGGH